MKHILSIRPKEYIKQGVLYCGGHTTKAILSAYGKDDGRPPGKYHPFLGKLIFGSMLPSEMKRIYQDQGLEAEILRANKLPDKEKLNVLKEELNQDHPIALVVGINPIIGHWISLWGYDDQEQVFYVYNSYAEKQGLPIGNEKWSYEKLLKQWKWPIQAWFWSYLYIPVKRTQTER